MLYNTNTYKTAKNIRDHEKAKGLGRIAMYAMSAGNFFFFILIEKKIIFNII
jgi:hypothetical protein